MLAQDRNVGKSLPKELKTLIDGKHEQNGVSDPSKIIQAIVADPKISQAEALAYMIETWLEDPQSSDFNTLAASFIEVLRSPAIKKFEHTVLIDYIKSGAPIISDKLNADWISEVLKKCALNSAGIYAIAIALQEHREFLPPWSKRQHPREKKIPHHFLHQAQRRLAARSPSSILPHSPNALLMVSC